MFPQDKAEQLASSDRLALAREILRVEYELARSGLVSFPIGFFSALVRETQMDPIWAEGRFFDLIGDTIMNCMSRLGPVYGKFSQIMLSRLDEEGQKLAEKFQLTRMYGKWPAIPFEDIQEVLDNEIPEWHQEFVVESYPLGVASMAQVHVATDENGQEWVIKVIKPDAKKRLEETLAALEQIVRLLRPIRLTSIGKRSIREIEELIRALRREVQLDLEKINIDKMRMRLDVKKENVLRLPETHDAYCTPNVLVIERFKGTSLVDVVAGKVEISTEQRKKLARKILQELMIQVFEIGIFHGDPHAGNLMLLDDGSVGIFDWGLTGELRDIDRKNISGILKALLMADMQRLVDVLLAIGEEHEVTVDRAEVEREIRKVADLIKEHKAAGTQPSFEALLETCLAGSERLGIPVPDGLLMMAKSLLTIEGLARGIDPEVSFARAAGPVLLRAAKPSIGEMLSMGKKLPGYMKKMIFQSA